MCSKRSAQHSAVASSVVITLTCLVLFPSSPRGFPGAVSIQQGFIHLLSSSELDGGSDSQWASSLNITAALLSVFVQRYCCQLPTAQGVMTLQTTKQTRNVWCQLASHFETPTTTKEQLHGYGDHGNTCHLVLGLSTPSSSPLQSTQPKGGGRMSPSRSWVFSQPPPCLALICSLICSVVHDPFPQSQV